MNPATETAWSRDPRAHIAVRRPTCGRAGCARPAMVWRRCRCGVELARCNDHHHAEPVDRLAAAHRCATRRAA